jgi:hypothetical protein
MKVEKTGKVVVVRPEDVIPLHKFMYGFMELDSDFYLNTIGRVREPNSKFSIDHIAPTKPKYLLTPLYRYFSLPADEVVERLGIEFQAEDRIKLENLSVFNVYEVVEGGDDGIDVFLEVLFELGHNRERAKVWGIWIYFVIYGSKNNRRHYNGVATDIGLSFYNDYLRTLRWARGRKFSSFSYGNDTGSKVINSVHNLGNNLFSLVNLFYNLYIGEWLEINETSYKLVKPFSDLLQSYGNTFEEVLSVIREVTVIVD